MKRWIRDLGRSKIAFVLLSFMAALYIRIVYYTSRWHHEGIEIPQSYIKEEKPFIVCFWHGRLFMIVCGWLWKDRPFHMLLSAHKDGQLIGRTVGHFGIKSIKGSTGRGGTQALRDLIKILKQGQAIGITPDGPAGPAQKASPGIITLSTLAQVDIIPATYSISRAYRFSTWDRFLFPFPFSRGIFIWGEPVPYPQNLSLEEVQQRLENALNDIQDQADKWVARTSSQPNDRKFT